MFQVHTSAAVRYPRARQARGYSRVFTNVDHAVLTTALRAANGDASRLEILGPTKVLVWNSRAHRAAMRDISKHL